MWHLFALSDFVVDKLESLKLLPIR